ncbi:putative saf domain-containing protein [Diplodia seriata]|uniref:Putative saf domain-containing protein n=1 Tax=Diplodia seriata TaxID=420778 RepID=A0A0G2DTG3_9PEZI|nr:putative saf domain-containing protein [Diplodia seriata]
MTSLSTKLAQLETAGKPIQIGLIGAGKFGSMFISQSHRTTGMRLAGIADLSAERALAALQRTGFPADAYDATGTLSIAAGLSAGKTAITTDAAELIGTPGIDVVLEVTGVPAAGIEHALLCCEQGKHVVMVNVEADVLAGPLLARKARDAGIVYSMAYGDQPALIAELVDWARAAGFDVVCAGKGTKHLPAFHYSTPATVWDHYGFTAEQLATGDFNAQMFNSFLDGTKSALEMAAVANGCDLAAPRGGLAFPPCGKRRLPEVLRPRADGGVLDGKGAVEVVSCLERDGRPVLDDLRWGVYVVIEAPGGYQKECFKQYGLETDGSGSIMCRGEPTGQTRAWKADVVATAKRDLEAGERLDGEGGFTVYGKLMTAQDSVRMEGLPIGLAHGFVLRADVKKDQALSWKDVQYEETQAVKVRREMEAEFGK